MIEYQLVEEPGQYPAACFCGRPYGPAVDTFVERHGERIYVCDKCVRRLALVFGYVPGGDADQLRTDLTAARERVVELESEVRLLRSRPAEVVGLDDVRALIAAERPAGKRKGAAA